MKFCVNTKTKIFVSVLVEVLYVLTFFRPVQGPPSTFWDLYEKLWVLVRDDWREQWALLTLYDCTASSKQLSLK